MVFRLLALIVLVALAGLVVISATPASRPLKQPAPIVVQSDRGGFDWADAAIGAAGAAGVVLAVAGVLVHGAVGSHTGRNGKATDDITHL